MFYPKERIKDEKTLEGGSVEMLNRNAKQRNIPHFISHITPCPRYTSFGVVGLPRCSHHATLCHLVGSFEACGVFRLNK